MDRESFMKNNAELVRRCRLARHEKEDKAQIILSQIFKYPPKKYGDFMFMPSLDIQLLHCLNERDLDCIIHILNSEGYYIEAQPFQKYLLETFNKEEVR